MILSKTVILVGGWTFVRRYTVQHSKDLARLSTNRSSFFIRNDYSTPLFYEKIMIVDDNLVKKRQ